jgi:hypothetical protein
LRHYGGNALTQADEAARLDTPDWQILVKLKRDGFRTLLPDVQQTRALAGALNVRFRGEVAGRRFDEALVTAKTILSLARHLGDHPTVIGDLVGIAVAMIALGSVEEMIQQPGCPNLYWALTELPNPLIDINKGLRGQRMMLAPESTGLDETSPLTEVQLQKALERAIEFAELAVGPGGPQNLRVTVRVTLTSRVNDDAHVKAARRRLMDYGIAADRVQRFPGLQVILLDEKYAYEVQRDEAMKGLTLPYWQAESAHAKVTAGNLGGLPLAWGPLAYAKVRQAKARLEQRIGLLRCVEALRMYAAEHDGNLPTKLDEIQVPLPIDPVTGKAFVYRLTGATATLQGTPPRGTEKNAEFNTRIEVTTAK